MSNQKRKKVKGLDLKKINLKAIEINTNKFLGIEPRIKPKRIFRPKILYISR